jgi:hypothetical protein
MHDDHDDLDGYDWNEGHPDHEGTMAVAQLHRLAKMSKMMLAIIGKNDELEGWVQYKISRAYNDLNDVFTYVQFKAHDTWVEEDHPAYADSTAMGTSVPVDDDDEFEFDDEEYEEEEYEDEYEEDLDDYESKLSLEKEGIEEAKKKKKGLWANIHAKRKRGEPPAKPGDPGRPDPKTWKKLTKGK